MKNLLELNHPQINVSKLVLLRGLCIQTLMVLQYQKMVLSAVIVSERWHREIHRSFLKAVFWKYKDILDFTKSEGVIIMESINTFLIILLWWFAFCYQAWIRFFYARTGFLIETMLLRGRWMSDWTSAKTILYEKNQDIKSLYSS